MKTNLNFIATSRSGHNWIMLMVQSWINDSQPYSYENKLPIEFKYLPDKRSINGVRFGSGNRNINFVVVRDLLNWYASFVKLRVDDGTVISDQYFLNHIGYWLAIAKEAYFYTNFVESKKIISYDYFRQSKLYRQVICRDSSGSYNEDFLNFVPTNGRSSSFDKRRFNGFGSQMKTSERFRVFDGENPYSRWLSLLGEDREVLRLYFKHFTIDDDKIDFIDRHKLV